MDILNQIPNSITLFSEHIGTKLDPLGDGMSSLELTRVSGTDVDIVNAARVSFGKFVTEITDKDKKLIQYLMDHEHTSPFEHNSFSFRVKCPLYVQRQWMRHRMASSNEISYRYVNSALEFYIPPMWRYQDKVNRQASCGSFENAELTEQYKKALTVASQTYLQLMEQGQVCREQARGLLPMCTYTEFMYTCNLHSLMHFMRLRMHAGAQAEIRAFAAGLYELALPHFPVALAAWKKKNAALFVTADDTEKK
jgi:thymidylate synthase (FAD)